ncbi:MAG TPA: DUF6495 family protein [Salinimicrobium sp.]|nr:DUF6495 family protein [Salinimicrobium sp.]
MKYARLTKEQFEELHQEFITFLSSQSITVDEWQEIKDNKPQLAEEELDVFSDMVWEAVLDKAEFLEHFSKQQIFLFRIMHDAMKLVAIKVDNDAIDITTKEGYAWLQDNLMDESVNIFKSSKSISEQRNRDIFALIQQGAVITKGDLFTYFEERLK